MTQALPEPLTPERMAELFGAVEMWDDKVERIWAHPETAATFPGVFGPDAYDREGCRVLLNIGLAGHLWGADVRTNLAIPVGEVELMGTDEWNSKRNSWLCQTACPVLRRG